MKDNLIKQRLSQTTIRLLVVLLLAGLAVFLVAQHQLVFMYHDDWGFSVLDHMARQEGFEKQNFSAQQFFAFLRDMYLDWSGRVMSFGAHILAERVGVGFVQMLQATLIFAFMLLALRVSQVAADSRLSAFVVSFGVLLYLALPESILAGGLYWYAASTSNAWTLPVFLYGVYRVLQTGRIDWFSAFLFAFSLTFHEQIAVSVLAFLGAWRLWQWRFAKESLWQDLVKLFVVFLVALPVIFAPGNFVRKAVSAPFYGDRSVWAIFSDNLNAISYHLLWPEWANIFILLMLVSSLFLAMWLWLKNNLASAEKKGVAAYATLLMILYATNQTTGFSVLFMLGFTWLLFRACRLTPNGGLIFAIHLAALASLLLVFMAPYFMGRTGIVLLFLEMVPVLYSAWLIHSHLPDFLKFLIIAVSAGLALPATAKIYEGYAANAPSHLYNDAQLRALSNQQTASPIESSDKTVRLMKLIDNKYAEIPADQHQHIQAWMKKYYGLDPDTRFIWVDPQAKKLTLKDIPQKAPDLVENGFNVYIEQNRLLYVKPKCSPADRQTFFELRYVPKDKRERDPYYFNQSFVFDGIEQEGTCLTLKRMPSEPFKQLKTHFHEVSFVDANPVQIERLVSTLINMPIQPTAMLKHANLDVFEDKGALIDLQGWAFHNHHPASKGYIRLFNPQHSFTFTITPVIRPDVKTVFPELIDSDVGFRAKIPTVDIPSGNYRIQYILEDENGKRYEMTFKGVAYQKP
ncbi:hypothetical protein AVO42_11600 [Thiomicrospira sp. XS5]|uniref:DUF6056 family protein n=1 Tax=Thiomicrospira sp. XS5 TaxID=1775636 RepID=UPI000748264B|nr:DUF6056 family protein [Thiomicrospira sp. XS5]KUJ75911.1 hypothetical protein AVO42_11600 [Thiomicrospira sp. XS5]